ncbi:MAG: ArdC-like ssDNA-binding domain-containing protein [Methanobacterium sp.]
MRIDKSLKGKELAKFLTAKLDEFADNICQDPDEILEFCNRWNNGFHNYSFNNLILAWIQKPDFSLLAGFWAWKKHNRQVKKGESAIRILAPLHKKIIDEDGEETYILSGFKPVPVFDLSQTEGEELDVGCSELIQGDVDFKSIIKSSPVPVKIAHLGLANGRTNGQKIELSPRKNKAAMAATYIHELSHILLGHCEGSGILFETDDRSVKEIEAETCSYIVCSFLGIDNNKSRLYVANWGGNKEELKGRGKKIIATAEKIIRSITSQGVDSNE